MKKNIPIRTCICCRDKFEQQVLVRLQLDDCSIVAYSGLGRSFYLCRNCIDMKRDIVLKKLLQRSINKNKSLILSRLEEILVNANS
jgi:predicted RNA-binding protein YlxR (DUF448 family)